MDADDSALIWQENGKRVLLKTPVFTVTETDSVASDGQRKNYIQHPVLPCPPICHTSF